MNEILKRDLQQADFASAVNAIEMLEQQLEETSEFGLGLAKAVDTLRAERAELQARIDAADDPFCFIHPMFVDRNCIGGEFSFFKPMETSVPLYRHPAIPPEGMMLVPVDPTDEMIHAGYSALCDDSNWPVGWDIGGVTPETMESKIAYKAMLKAVPAKGE